MSTFSQGSRINNDTINMTNQRKKTYMKCLSMESGHHESDSPLQHRSSTRYSLINISNLYLIQSFRWDQWPWCMAVTCLACVWSVSCNNAGRPSHLTDVLNLSAQMAVKTRQEMQEKLMATVVSSESEQLKRFEELMELKQRQEYQSMRDMMDRE